MIRDFGLTNITVTEFGIGLDENGTQVFTVVPVNGDVQKALQEMAIATNEAMNVPERDTRLYEPSEKHAGSEYVTLPITDELASKLRLLHEANNLEINSGALEKTGRIFCYFARFLDSQGRRLTALRRSTQFKGVLKSRLVRLMGDTLQLIDDRVFKLDSDFDLLIDGTTVHILRPTAFELVSKLQQTVLASAPKNAAVIQKNLPYLDLGPIEAYASKHPRAARLLASINSQDGTKGIERRLLERTCKEVGVEIGSAKGKLLVQEKSILGFLEVLDRRRYQLELAKDSPERFRATARTKL